MDLLEELIKKRKFYGTNTRLNVAAHDEKVVHFSGRVFLKDKIMSDVLRKGALFEEVQRQLPWVHQITVNKNLMCTPHKDRHVGTSMFCMFGDFEGGGGLFVDEPGGLRHITKKEPGTNSTASIHTGRRRGSRATDTPS